MFCTRVCAAGIMFCTRGCASGICSVHVFMLLG